MKYRSLTKTLSPSILTFGCWPLGGKYWGPIDVPEIERSIQKAIEFGINCFDTAPLYGDGLADERLTKALGSHRHNVIIATKVGARVKNGHAQSDLSAKFIRSDVEESLRRLRLESIPLLQVHWPCQQGTSLQETFSELNLLQEEGKIQHIGVCNYNSDAMHEICKLSPIASLQTPYSLIRREFEQNLQPFCLQNDIGVLAYEGLCRGLLSGKYIVPPRFNAPDLRANDPRFSKPWFWHTRSLLDNLEKVAQKVNVPVSAISLAWLCTQPTISSVVVGIKSVQQLKENISTLRIVNRDKLVSIVSTLINMHGGFVPP
jgi:methylglyoxal reductase